MYGIKEYPGPKLKETRAVQKIPGKILPANYFAGKNMASGAPRGHIITGIFFTGKVSTLATTKRKTSIPIIRI